MDNSKKYTQMCREAKEIQELRKFFQDGDIYNADGGVDGIITHCDGCDINIKRKPIGKRFLGNIWLPRQDQLQEILIGAKSRFRKLNNNIDIIYKNIFEIYYVFLNFPYENYAGWPIINTPRQDFDTLEQCWLAFIMFEKYNKIWNGETWITSS